MDMNFYVLNFVFLNFWIGRITTDPCSETKYTIIDDYKRSPRFQFGPSERRLCDNQIKHGWYRFQINGSDAEMPTKCIANGCGTRAPLWLSPPAGGLPKPGKKSRSHACASFEVPGRELKCCALKFPVTVKNCGDFFVYRLRSTKGCDLAYCAEAVTTVCAVGQVYVLHLQKCVDIIVEISQPRLHVKKYSDRVSVLCLFDIKNKTVSQHKPTFSVTWIKIRNSVSTVVKFKFVSDTRDQIVLGKDVFTGDSVACEVMPVHQSNSKVSETLFLGIQIMESDIILRENGHTEKITLISTVPLLCKHQDKKCKLDMVLSVKYSKGNILSDVLLSHCLLEFHPNDRCQGIGCIIQEVKIAMTPNLFTLEAKEVHIAGYIYVDEEIVWNQDRIETKVKVIDLPSSSCFVTAGVFILSFQHSISKISRRGTYVLYKSKDLEIQLRVNSCTGENLVCVCGIALYYMASKLVIDTCKKDKDKIEFHYHPAMRANMKIFEGRHGKLIYVVLDGKAQLRIDLRQTGMSVTLQASGYFTSKADGLCGFIGNKTKDEAILTNQPFIGWRLIPGVSLFDNYEVFETLPSTSVPACDCSRSSYETSCPQLSSATPAFLLQLTETTSHWLNKTRTSNEIPDYIFDGDFDNNEIVTKQPAKDGQLANDICAKMFMTSGIAKTCLNKVDINVDTVINICVALATSYRNSTWMPEVLRLLENLCETHLNQNITSTNIKNLNIDDIRQAILCPEGCYGNGICTERGCYCNQGYSGVECLTKAVLFTVPLLPETTVDLKFEDSNDDVSTTTTTKSTTVPSTTTPTTTVSSTTTAPSTTTMSSTTTSPSTTTTTVAITTPSTSASTETPVVMVTCDRRSSPCSAVYVNMLQMTTGEFAVKCHITLVQFTRQGWEPVGNIYTSLLRYVDSNMVECMLPIVTRGDNFVNVYRIQVAGRKNTILKTQLMALVDDLCQFCDINTGCMLKTNTCFIDKTCYRHQDVNPKDKCVQCIPSNSKSTWSLRTDNSSPVIEPDHLTLTAIEGDTVTANISARDPEQMTITYSTEEHGVTVTTSGKCHVDRLDKGLHRFVINVSDSCGASSVFVLSVVVRPCDCKNGGVCVNENLSQNRSEVNCSCLPPFTGRRCESKISSCHSNPCYPGVTCTDMIDTYKCENCLPGYQGDGITCIKTCSSQPCFPGVECTDLIRPVLDKDMMGYVCGSCPQYFYGNGEKCYRSEKKACNNSTCSPLVTCEEVRDYPGYRCGICPQGYMGNGTSCQAFCFPPCTDGRECIRPGVCGCRQGYGGPNCNQAVCSVPCQNGGICYQPDRCFCSPGFTGRYCETGLCEHGCMNGGSCLGVNMCACRPGYRGHRCQIESCSISCLNGGSCVGFNRCQCTPEYKGVFCEQAVCDPVCLNGGVCVRPDTCYCPLGFYGEQCGKVFCHPPCGNGGYCLTGNQCQCQPGFTGSHCHFKSCSKNICGNGGRCVGSDVCVCKAGWTGKHCRRPTCHLGCQNGGYCYQPNRCRCRHGYWGPFCQYPLCYPPCAYGSVCTRPNFCSCRKYYTGKYCRMEKIKTVIDRLDKHSSL